MGNHDDRGARFALGHLEDLQDLGLDGDVERSGGLVGDDDARVVGHGNSDDDALAHAAGEFVWEGLHALFRLRDADELEQANGLFLRFLRGDIAVGLDGFDELVTDGEHRGQGGERILEDHGDILAADLRHFLVGLANEIGAGIDHGAFHLGVVGQQAHDGQRGHGLTGA